MKYLLTGVAAIAMLTACGDKDKPVKDPETGAEYAAEALPELKLRAGDPATAAQALAALSLDSSEAGRLSFGDSTVSGDKATFTNVTILHESDEDDEDDEDADVKVAKLEFEGLGMFDGKANFASMKMSDISIVPTDPEEAEKGGATIKSMELINPSPEMAAWVATLFDEGEPEDLPKGEALAFDRWAMSDLNFHIEDDEETGTFLISTIEVNSLQEQKAAQMLLKDMTFDMVNPSDDLDMKANIGTFDIRGMDLSLFAEEEDEDIDADSIASSFQSGFMSGFSRPQDPANPGYDSINLQDVDIDVSGVSFVMDKLVSKVARDDQDRAVKVVTEPTTLKLNAGEGELGSQLATQLATMGYEGLELTMAGEQTYDPDADVTTLPKGKNYWELKDGFRLDFSGKYEGASAMAQAAEDQSGMTSLNPSETFDDMFGKLSIHAFELSLDDNGIVDRAFNAYAAQSGQDPQELRNQTAGLLAMAPMMAAGSGVDAELITEATTALSSFITEPKTLTIKMAPETPLKMSELAEMDDPSSLTKASLGFSAKNE